MEGKMYIQRKGILFLVLISILFCICLQAQDSSAERNSLKEGAWALQFGIGGNFTLTSFQGSTISVKYQLSDRTAIRGGITINGSNSNGNNSASGAVADSSYGTLPGNSSTNGTNVSFVLQYLWYLNPSGPVHFYVGVGPSVAYNYSHSSSETPYFVRQGDQNSFWEQSTYNSNSHLWTAGGTGVAGVEWFAIQWLSLRAEYSESIQYQWSSTNSSSDYSYTNPDIFPYHFGNSGTTKTWALNSSGVSFGLSVYW
jgi:hypothetical protein